MIEFNDKVKVHLATVPKFYSSFDREKIVLHYVFMFF